MGKRLLILTIISFLFLCISCKQLNRNNPTDPKSSTYIGITYDGQLSNTSGATIRAMNINSGLITFGAYTTYASIGDCVIEILGSQQLVYIGTTGNVIGTFADITDMCNDGSGDLFVTDNKSAVQIIDPQYNFHYFNVTATSVSTLYLACYQNSIYLANTSDKTIQIYGGGSPTNLDIYNMTNSVSVTVTANGYFSPGRIFTSANYIFVVNSLNKKEVLKLSHGSLAMQADIIFGADVIDAALYSNNTIQLLSEQAVYQINENLSLAGAKEWGNFGQGDGRVINGQLIAYDNITGKIYILDGTEIKIFGSN